MAKIPGTKKGGGMTIMVPKSFRKKLDDVKKEIGAKSDSEVIRRAFMLLKKLAYPDLKLPTKRKPRGATRAQRK